MNSKTMACDLTSSLADKLCRLKNMLIETGGCAIAFSGGVDSTLLLAVAHEVLGDRCLAVIAVSSTYPKREYEEAMRFVCERGIPHAVIESEELDIAEFADNPPNRCYYCKRELFAKVREEADKRGLPCIADGANLDDLQDFRPGLRAAKELDVLHPLQEAELGKEEIRLISKIVYGLSTADKQAMACMSSRFPYGDRITRDKLKQVEAVEDFLHQHGFRTFRARHHGDTLRLELGQQEIELMLQQDIRGECVKFAKEQGFTYITIDLEGFRSGSMNEALDKEEFQHE